MANINQISLKVCGNPDANSGFQTMAIFNSPSIEIKDNFYTGFDANSYFFTIKIEKNCWVVSLYLQVNLLKRECKLLKRLDIEL